MATSKTKKPAPKATAKKTVKAPAKPVAKKPAKPVSKTVSKPVAKKPAKAPAKVAAKKPAAKKTTAKTPVKVAPAKKPAAKAPAKSPAKVIAKTPAKKPAAKAPVKKPAPKKSPAPAKKPAAKPVATKAAPTKAPVTTKTSSKVTVKPAPARAVPNAANFKPYVAKKGEVYMNKEQLGHFAEILTRLKDELLADIERTVHTMQDEQTVFADPNDRASQETDMALELRNRDRERKLIKKIEETLGRIRADDYGYCDKCGIEIGVQRLEARPTATLCIDCKTLEELREKQVAK